MTETNRGVIKNRQFANQVKDFSGLLYRKITPTDIDGLMDFGNKVFVLIELKYGDCEVKTGQKLAIERVVDNLQELGKPTIAIIARHNSEGDIDVANCSVDQIRFEKRWIPQRNPRVKLVIDKFLLKYAPEYIHKG